jgi:DNA-binding NarL/FixJ family response regulator
MVGIVIVDGHEEYRNYLCDYLSNQRDFEVVGAAADSYEAIRLVDTHKPDVVLMDGNLPEGDGEKTAALIRYKSPNTQVILNGNGDERRILSVFLSGVSGYLTKKADGELLCHGIRTVYYGGSLISAEVAVKFRRIAAGLAGKVLKSRGELRSAQFDRRKQNTDRFPDDVPEELPQIISPSEIQIMSFVGQGYSNREISEKIGLSEGTIRNYVSSLLQKLGFRDRIQIAIYAIKTGISVPS